MISRQRREPVGKGPNPIIGQPTEAAQMDYLVTDEEGALVQGMRSEERGTPVCFGIGFWDLMAPELLQNWAVSLLCLLQLYLEFLQHIVVPLGVSLPIV